MHHLIQFGNIEKIKIDIKLFGLKRSIVLRTPFFNVFKVKKLKEGRSTLPRSFSRLAVVQLLGGCILYLTKHKRKKHRKTAWRKILFLFGFAIAI